MTLQDLRVMDLYDLMDELDDTMQKINFNGTPFVYRTGVKRMRNYLDHVASGLRMIRGGDYEPHNIDQIHRHNKRMRYE